MTMNSIESCYLIKESNSKTKTVGDNFTDKRLLTDKPLMNTKNDYF